MAHYPHGGYDVVCECCDVAWGNKIVAQDWIDVKNACPECRTKINKLSKNVYGIEYYYTKLEEEEITKLRGKIVKIYDRMNTYSRYIREKNRLNSLEEKMLNKVDKLRDRISQLSIYATQRQRATNEVEIAELELLIYLVKRKAKRVAIWELLNTKESND